jgi:type 1 glutamine amidotransferase
MRFNPSFPMKLASSLVFTIALLLPMARSWAAAATGKNIVFLVSSTQDTNSYESGRTIPPFAEMLKKDHGYQTTVCVATMPESKATFANFEAVAKADLLVIFCRRLGLPPEQLMTIKNHLNAGKPVVALKTANHGFAVRGDFASGHIPWYEFVADVLGAENRGYAGGRGGMDIKVVPANRNHPIVRGLPANWKSGGNLYLTAPLLDRKATVLLEGTVEGRPTEPIAWTRMAGESRVFYTSMGHPADFDDTQPHFRTLLLNGIRWALGENAAR